jgi:hypothetical protein
LVADIDKAAFDVHWPRLDPDYGRWLCWLAFFVGSENIGKGAFGLRGQTTSNMSQFKKFDHHFGMSKETSKCVSHAFAKLKTIRDQEAHEFRKGVRDAYFQEVATLFVPALNEVWLI